MTIPNVQEWIESYKAANAAVLDADPEFRQWLEEDYSPIWGGWQY
jgi:hypothetical protein